jgi:hypothetical protein
MAGTAMPPARKRLREVLTVEISLQIVNVYAGLNGDKSALWYDPTISSSIAPKLPVLRLFRVKGTNRFQARRAGSIAV